ncbi:MAG: sugar transferase [Clostridia bacterium]|nr:sugar transferase [Clostridia bacterium]
MKQVYDKVFKRILDLILSVFALLILSVPMGVLAVLVRVKLGAPVVFQQQRPGRNGKIFTLYKFRTMTNERDENGELLPDEVRLTAFGQTLRKLSLDELPELFNILRGDMSFVGPRPLLIKYLPLYNERQAHRHDVRPGLTGLAQVNGRNLLSWNEKFEYDVKYVENESFLLDLQITFKTIVNVLKREGISSQTSATMEEFAGNRDGDEVTLS